MRLQVWAIGTFFLWPLAAMAQWALPIVSVANVRTAPYHSAELATQVLMGHTLKIIADSVPDWLEVEGMDGYRGWVSASQVQRLDSVAIEGWYTSPRVMVSSMGETEMWVDTLRRSPVTDLIMGDIARLVEEPSSQWVKIALPDGRKGFVWKDEIVSLDNWMSVEPSVQVAVNAAMGLIGRPYLWGGTSTKAMDCSGLVRIAYLKAGILLPRDASQQAMIGEPLKAPKQAGDLIFFGNPATGRINHVGIYDGHGGVIHATGRVRHEPLSELPATRVILAVRRLIE